SRARPPSSGEDPGAAGSSASPGWPVTTPCGHTGSGNPAACPAADVASAPDAAGAGAARGGGGADSPPAPPAGRGEAPPPPARPPPGGQAGRRPPPRPGGGEGPGGPPGRGAPGGVAPPPPRRRPPPLGRRPKDPIGRHQPADPLVNPLEVVMVDEQADPAPGV